MPAPYDDPPPAAGPAVRVLGEVEVVLDGELVRVGGPRQVALLALLVAAGGRSVPAERLVDQLWGETPPDNAAGALQVGVAKLRRQLEPRRQARGEATLLVTRAGGYALDLPPGAVDAARFAALVDRARGATDPATAEAGLVEALGLWRGAPYGGVAGLAPALATEARRLDELRWSAVERLWDVRLGAGGHTAAVPELRALVEEAPLREELWRLLVLALYRSGRQAEALEAVREVRERLADELGIDPGEPLRRLEQDVLRQDASLDVATPAIPAPAVVTPPAGDTAPLPGRERLLEHTAGLVAQARAGRGGVLLVSGDAGIGKTRFCRAVADQAAAAGLSVGWGTWEQEDGPPLWGWRQAFAALPVGTHPLTAGGEEPDGASTVFRLADEVADSLRASPSAWCSTTSTGPTPTATGCCAAWSRHSARCRRCSSSRAARRRPTATPRRRTRWLPSPAATPTASTCGASTVTGWLHRCRRRWATRWTRRWRTPCARAPTATRSTSARWSGPSRRPACSRVPASTTGAAFRRGSATSYATGSRGCRRRWVGH